MQTHSHFQLENAKIKIINTYIRNNHIIILFHTCYHHLNSKFYSISNGDEMNTICFVASVAKFVCCYRCCVARVSRDSLRLMLMPDFALHANPLLSRHSLRWHKKLKQQITLNQIFWSLFVHPAHVSFKWVYLVCNCMFHWKRVALLCSYMQS